MEFCHRYGGWFQFVKFLKSKSLHINGLKTREVLWVNLFTKYLTYLSIIMCAFSVKIVVSNHKHVMLFNCKMIFFKGVNICQIKIQNFNCWNVIFWMKIQNSAWFQYKTFLCCNFYLIVILYIHIQRTFFAMISK